MRFAKGALGATSLASFLIALAATPIHETQRELPPELIKHSFALPPETTTAEDSLGIKEESQFCGPYVVVTTRNLDDGTGWFGIFKNGVCEYEHSGYSFQIGSIYESEKTSTLIPVGRDITGDGTPNVVVSEWTGGAHSSFIFRIFSLGEHVRLIGTIDAGHGDLSDFQDARGDGKLVFIGADWTFAYWHTSFASSPAPSVLLEYRDHAYHLAFDIMARPAPSPEEFTNAISEIQESEWVLPGIPPVSLWWMMLELIYTGHRDLAWQFFRQAWPAKQPGQDEFLASFRDKLAESPYWSELRHWQ